MRSLLISVGLVCAAGLLATLALGQTASGRTHENAHHVLLMLEQQEAIEHARALHQFAHGDAGDLERDVVARHVAEIGDNLDAIDSQITEIQGIDGDGERFDMSVAELRNHNAIARENLAALKGEAGLATPDACPIGSRSAALCDALRQGLAHHRRAMRAHRVPALLEPTVDG